MRSDIIRIFLCAALMFGAGTAAAITAVWSTDFHTTGPNDQVNCLLSWEGAVYAGGEFSAIGQTTMTCGVALEEDGVWVPVGDAFDSDGVISLCIQDGALHALGRVTGGRRVWRLDGGNWSPVGPLLNDDEEVLASYLGDLYLGSHRLEGDTWVERLDTTGRIKDLVVHDGLLVAGGEFTTAGGLATGHVCAWDGGAVVNAHSGQDAVVRNIESWNGKLHAARYSGSGPLVGVQVWEAGAWNDIPALGDVTYTDVISDIAAGDGRLLVCGYSFQIIVKADGTRGSSLRSWNGSTVESLYTPPANVRFLTTAEGDDGAWLGGSFTIASGPYPANLGLVRGGGLEPVCSPGLGASGTVDHLKPGPFGMAIGGTFWSIGRISSRGVALYDSGSWESWGLQHWGDPSWYYSPMQLAWNGNYLYTYASGHANHGVGRWSFGSWDFGDWIYQEPSDLVGWSGLVLGTSGDAIYTYDTFSDPTEYSAVGGTTTRLLVYGGDLIVGGEFTSINGIAANNIAVKSGSSWLPVGDGLPERVVALGTYFGDLVAVIEGPGGQNDVNDIMVCSGETWTPLGQLTGGRVACVQEYAGCLFLGGWIDMLDSAGVPMRGIACWNGAAWESVGEAYSTRALAVHDGELWVGGFFLHAGGVPASRLTSLQIEVTGGPIEPDVPAVVALSAPVPNPFNPRTTLHFDMPRAGSVRLEAYDAAGRRVAIILDEQRSAGRHAVAWTGVGDGGRALPSGTYLMRLQVGNVATTTKAALVR